MENFLNKFFFRSSNLNYISHSLVNLTKQTPAKRIFEALNTYNDTSEVRYVGGCVRKVINKEVIDDIDLATNLKPTEVCDALKKKDINFYETGLEHGTITAIIDEHKYEITSLRKDVTTDGRRANVEFSIDWKEDSARRDFSINSIYSDKEGNLFDPYDGKKDIENGIINFIGDAEDRIKEDYLRILRYIRFFLNYSKQSHNPQVIKIIKRNIEGISKLSAERLIDELKKLINSNGFKKIFKDEISLELLEIIFPQFKNLQNLKKLNSYALKNLTEIDFVFFLSLLIVDGTDNVDYFIYKFNISKKDQKRLKVIDFFYKENVSVKNFTEKNLNETFYFKGRQAVLDIINFKLFNLKTADKKLLKLIEIFKHKIAPKLPIGANILMSRYKIPEGKLLGIKLKLIEETWVQNSFQISEKQIQKIIKS